MSDESVQTALGRIEQKVDDLKEQVTRDSERWGHALFGPDGLEPRVRGLESDTVAFKAKTSLASAIVSFSVAALFTLVGWFFKKS